jgi:hypothetical protein
MSFEEPTKLELFLDGFDNFLYALGCYSDGHKYGYGDFWEALSYGWYQEYIYPYDDLYHPKLSDERVLRLGK